MLNSYLRMKTSDEEVYEEEGHHGIADWAQGVVRWREEKACTGTGLVHFGDPEHRYGWPSNQLSSLMLILVASLLLLHYSLCADQYFCSVGVCDIKQIMCIHFVINTCLNGDVLPFALIRFF